MKGIGRAGTAAGFLCLIAFWGAHGQDDAGKIDQRSAALIKEIQQQQALIANNQAKIDEKLAAVTEAVRVARLYSSRSGR